MTELTENPWPTRTTAGVDHVFLTRFNLPSAGVESLIRAQDGWLRDRVALFERYTLPSMAAQTSQSWFWVVYFDPESPQWLRDKIEVWSAEDRFNAVFREAVPTGVLLADLEKITGRRHADLLTTNLDNDDGVAVDFAERLQSADRRGERSAVYYVNGLIVSPKGLYRRADHRNAFCSVRASWDAPATCWAEWHNLLGETMPVVEVDGPPGWLQVVHGANVSNRVRGVLTRPEAHRRRFPGMLEDVVDPGPARLAFDRFIRSPGRAGRDRLRVTAKNAVVRLFGKDGLDRLKLGLGAIRRR